MPSTNNTSNNTKKYLSETEGQLEQGVVNDGYKNYAPAANDIETKF